MRDELDGLAKRVAEAVVERLVIGERLAPTGLVSSVVFTTGNPARSPCVPPGGKELVKQFAIYFTQSRRSN